MTESFAELFENSLANQRIRPGMILSGLVVDVTDDVDRAYKNAQWAYQTPRSELDVVVIRATDARMHFLRSGPALGWDRFVSGKIKTFDVDAEHDLVFAEPSLSQLIDAFEICVSGE